MTLKWDQKKDWVNKKKELYRGIICSTSILPMEKQRVYDNRKGLWETPKKYVDGFAYNDGSWLIYNTFRVNKGTLKYKYYCKTKKELICDISNYMYFLKQIGVTNHWEMTYYTLCFIVNKLAFREGLFKYNTTNYDLIKNMSISVINSNNVIKGDWKDDRKYCIDPKMKKNKKKSEVVSIQRKKDKEVNWNKIEELYDDSKTNKENLQTLKDNGIDISERTLQRWKKEHIKG